MCFQQTGEATSNIERRAAEALRTFLGTIPQLPLWDMTVTGKPDERDPSVDIVLDAEFAGRPMRLVVEVKGNGQPRMAHQAAYQLKRYLDRSGQGGVPMFMAPYISEQSQTLCREEGIGYLDFEKNARIAFEPVLIDRRVEGKVAASSGVGTTPMTERARRWPSVPIRSYRWRMRVPGATKHGRSSERVATYQWQRS